MLSMTNSRVESTDLFFKRLIDLVPAQAYFDTESNQKLSAARVKTATEGNKRSVQASRTDKAKAKRVKFDPSSIKHTSALQELLPTLPSESESEGDYSSDDVEPADEESTPQKVNSGSQKSVSCCFSGDTRTHHESNADHSVTANNNKIELCNGILSKKKKSSSTEKKYADTKAKPTNGSTDNSDSDKHASEPPSPAHNRPTPEQLREKLRARIEALQSIRKKDLTAEEFVERKRLRRKESKLKLKMKRKAAKKLKVSVEKQAKNQDSKTSNGVSEVKQEESEAAAPNKFVFSKFEFSDQAQKKNRKDKKKPKSYKELYEKVTQEKQKIEELQQTDAEKAKKVIEKNAWKKAMDMSKGVKVKDDADLIKKSMKREEKLKNRSAKKWKERTDLVEEQQQKRQEKRKKNINAKKQGRINKKMDKAKKKGRIISGF